VSITKDEAQKLLEPWYPVFWHSVNAGFQRHYETHANELHIVQPRTKSSYVNDFIVDGLRQGIRDASTVWEERHGQRRLWIKGKVCIRVKKLNRRFQPSNIPTQATFEFLNQFPLEIPAQLKLPDMPSATNLFLGYRVTATQTAIQGVYIVCPKGEDVLGVT